MHFSDLDTYWKLASKAPSDNYGVMQLRTTLILIRSRGNRANMTFTQ
jgi:hypothetical protein